MALYGAGSTSGYIAFTGWTNTLLGNTQAGSGPNALPSGFASGFVQFNGMTQFDNIVSRHLNKRGMSAFAAMIEALSGAAVGANTAQDDYSRVTARQGLTTDLGGLVPVEVTNTIARLTTAADLVDMLAMQERETAPETYPGDASGNGGGGRAGY